MGITAKPFGKFRGTLQKIDNERAKEHQLLNKKKGKKQDKDS